MALNENFKSFLDPFVKSCHLCGHKLTSVLLVATMWYDKTKMYEKMSELEGCFQKATISAIHSIPYSIRFDGSLDQISACNAVDLLMFGYDGAECLTNQFYLYPSTDILTCLESVNLSI
jgi:hypothetical protein